MRRTWGSDWQRKRPGGPTGHRSPPSLGWFGPKIAERRRTGAGRGVMSQDEDTVGVVVPMFNSERTIAATLQSICGQTHRKLDIVVVDDGSTDDSAKVVKAWCERDRRVRLVRQSNRGVAAARNAGVASTDAALLAFIDADDLWAPSKIEFQLKTLQEGGPAVGLVYCWYATIDQDNRVVSFGPQQLDEGRVLRQLCAVNLIGNGSSVLVRRTAFDAAGGYGKGVDGAEDYLICLRIAEHAEFRVAPRYLVGYRRTPGSISTKLMSMFRSTEIVLSEYRTRFPDYASDIDGNLQNFRHWYAWGALKAGQVNDAATLIAESLAHRPIAASVRFCAMALETVKGRLLRRVGLGPPTMPIYTETIW
ncbi:MAG: glycosyltransferase family 2 protein [Reyranellales bacterium]